jgi:hypothetical protein
MSQKNTDINCYILPSFPSNSCTSISPTISRFLNNKYLCFIYIKKLSVKELVFIHNKHWSVELFFHYIVIKKIDSTDAHGICFP